MERRYSNTQQEAAKLFLILTPNSTGCEAEFMKYGID